MIVSDSEVSQLVMAAVLQRLRVAQEQEPQAFIQHLSATLHQAPCTCNTGHTGTSLNQP